MPVREKEIIPSTLKLAKKVGWEKVSVRMIAREIGYSTIKIYSDFGSKELLFFEIRKRGFEKLKMKYQHALEQSEELETKLENLALTHIRFAIEHPTYYELMFRYKLDNCESDTVSVKREAANLIYGVIKQLGAADASNSFFQFFATLSGFVQISNDFPEWEERNSELIVRQFVKNFIKGMK